MDSDNSDLFFPEFGKHVNGDARTKKHSVTDSLHSKTRFSDVADDDDDR